MSLDLMLPVSILMMQGHSGKKFSYLSFCPAVDFGRSEVILYCSTSEVSSRKTQFSFLGSKFINTKGHHFTDNVDNMPSRDEVN
jgi:hypothetical protein